MSLFLIAGGVGSAETGGDWASKLEPVLEDLEWFIFLKKLAMFVQKRNKKVVYLFCVLFFVFCFLFSIFYFLFSVFFLYFVFLINRLSLEK